MRDDTKPDLSFKDFSAVGAAVLKHPSGTALGALKNLAAAALFKFWQDVGCSENAWVHVVRQASADYRFPTAGWALQTEDISTLPVHVVDATRVLKLATAFAGLNNYRRLPQSAPQWVLALSERVAILRAAPSEKKQDDEARCVWPQLAIR